MKTQYKTGKGARENFENTMHKLFRVPKPPKKEKPPKRTASEEKKN
jgi:hypothetical protein